MGGSETVFRQVEVVASSEIGLVEDDTTEGLGKFAAKDRDGVIVAGNVQARGVSS